MIKKLIILFIVLNQPLCIKTDTIEYTLEKTDDGTVHIVQKTYKTTKNVDDLDKRNIPAGYEITQETFFEYSCRLAYKYKKIIAETVAFTAGAIVERKARENDYDWFDEDDLDTQILIIANRALMVGLSLDVIVALPDIYQDLKEGRKYKFVHKK